MDAGEVPALKALRDANGTHLLTTVFPSVTGPAYVPFLMGEHPGHVGLPGLRWFDRSRRDTDWPDYTRSYIGSEMRKVDRDLTLETKTAFERAGGGLAMMNMIGRGLPKRNKLTDSVGFALRAGFTHFRGDVAGWLNVDRALSKEMLGARDGGATAVHVCQLLRCGQDESQRWASRPDRAQGVDDRGRVCCRRDRGGDP